MSYLMYWGMRNDFRRILQHLFPLRTLNLARYIYFYYFCPTTIWGRLVLYRLNCKCAGHKATPQASTDGFAHANDQIWH